MKEYQQRNDAKYQAFANYKAQGSINELAKRDEEIMLKHIAEREAKDNESF